MNTIDNVSVICSEAAFTLPGTGKVGSAVSSGGDDGVVGSNAVDGAVFHIETSHSYTTTVLKDKKGGEREKEGEK